MLTNIFKYLCIRCTGAISSDALDSISHLIRFLCFGVVKQIHLQICKFIYMQIHLVIKEQNSESLKIHLFQVNCFFLIKMNHESYLIVLNVKSIFFQAAGALRPRLLSPGRFVMRFMSCGLAPGTFKPQQTHSFLSVAMWKPMYTAWPRLPA